MKPLYRRCIIAICLFTVVTSIALIGTNYLQYISQRIYEDSTGHLVEVYSQVNRNFTSFLERNWGNLNDWDQQIIGKDDAEITRFLKGRQDYWAFSDFYFLSEDGAYLTIEGEKGNLALEGTHDKLFGGGESIISNETTPMGQTVTVFAAPVPEGNFNGFDYSAIAMSYTNADMIHSLHAEAFMQQSVCFVTDMEGRVLLSTQEGGSVFGNYVSYLRAASDLDEKALTKLMQEWKQGNAGAVSCKIGSVSYYISYQSVGYQDCILLGVVPESVASASLLLIQRATVYVLVEVFALAGAMIILWLVYIYWRKSRKGTMELKYREMMFNTLSGTVNDVFLMVDAKTYHVDFLSSNVERLLGIPHRTAVENITLIGETAAEKLEYNAREVFTSIPIHGNRHWEREHIHRGTGERVWFRQSVYRENIQGTEKYLIVMSDRTQERQMNRNLQEALDAAKSANEAKSHFLSNMSHDIRTPMNAIIGFSLLLTRDADNAEKVREYTRKISASGSHLLSLINDVLDMSKIESGKTSLNVTEFSLPEFLEELYMILLPQAKAKKQVFEMRLEGQMPEQLLGDKLRLNQILINLLSNAVKYTQTGGQIDFVVEDLPKTSGQYVFLRFKVKDNGCGMSEEFLQNIFSPFTREETSRNSGVQGTGLGMAITKNLVELMGGTIAVESKPGEGSIFTVELSFARSTYEMNEDYWKENGISRVLVADDEEDICIDIQTAMQGTGVEVSYVTDGHSAVDAALRAKEEGRAFHIILLDWRMPGLNGVETARLIREKVHEDVPILVLTSYDWGDIEDEARAAGIDAFMQKPFFVSSFRHTLETLKPSDTPKEEPVVEDLSDVLSGMRFLVAEDNELNAEILAELLDIENAEHERAQNGQEAVEMFKKSAPGYYDMILMDVQMPVMNGYEATRAIRACGHPKAETIPIVAMTANAFAEDVRNAMDAGMNAHIAKPVDMAVVRKVISKLQKEERGE